VLSVTFVFVKSRKLFLAVHHILKYRGNFLYEGASFDSNASTLDDVIKQALENMLPILRADIELGEKFING